MRLLDRLAAVLVSLASALAAAALGLALLAAPAHAEDGYTYWGYYQLDGRSWTFAQKGPDSLTPADGAVEGWRFATTVTSSARPPRTDLTFEEICSGVQAGEGEKRVGVVIDTGTAEDAPEGDEPPEPEAPCAVVPVDATGAQVLSAVAQTRVEDGITCAIDGYPATGCGTPVKDAAVPADEQSVDFAVPASEQQSAPDATTDDGGVSWGLVGAGVLVVALAGAGTLLARRRA